MKIQGYLTIGITSISRPAGANYLLETIQSLLNKIDDANKVHTYIVVYLADFNETLKTDAANTISELFHKEIEADLLHVIQPFPQYYPQLSKLRIKFGDSQDRTKWRAKQNLDFAFLMCYCQELSKYHLHIEDDVTASPSFFQKLQEFISSQEKPWPMLDLSAMGQVAKVYHSNDLGNIASYLFLMYDELPVDWLIAHWRVIKEPENANAILPAAALFQHIGARSSLREKKRLSNPSFEKYVDRYDHKYKGLNPPANVMSSILPNKGHPHDAYFRGNGYFWGKQIKMNSSVVVRFHSVVNVKHVFVDTGSNLAEGDWLRFGVLQGSFVSKSSYYESGGANSSSCGYFQTIAPFEKGKVNLTLQAAKEMVCLRILVTQDQAEYLFPKEIDVWQE
ncbi:Alpha-1,3-mannosyl-glycoprotein 4-beta-N-acetylglucosaminyltransferase C [Desmophyllum pertusum]|uniref:Alpha-1,3-mannosyl-glycoprotein 4-beta-N-acetylglucosaminyltransferase C n=1 Tax=Desmophyllum pertusum TaxID=174260 RepID=A0A9W9Z9T5_9CNID|nr:Alpha-1,3-mannosyl-glycoprotein 4-beta-N-acetylglucosaminyltransferase C [Desmophyllum pertusum]